MLVSFGIPYLLLVLVNLLTSICLLATSNHVLFVFFTRVISIFKEAREPRILGLRNVSYDSCSLLFFACPRKSNKRKDTFS